MKTLLSNLNFGFLVFPRLLSAFVIVPFYLCCAQLNPSKLSLPSPRRCMPSVSHSVLRRLHECGHRSAPLSPARAGAFRFPVGAKATHAVDNFLGSLQCERRDDIEAILMFSDPSASSRNFRSRIHSDNVRLSEQRAAIACSQLRWKWNTDDSK